MSSQTVASATNASRLPDAAPGPPTRGVCGPRWTSPGPRATHPADAGAAGDFLGHPRWRLRGDPARRMRRQL